jgi:hypothetical protein
MPVIIAEQEKRKPPNDVSAIVFLGTDITVQLREIIFVILGQFFLSCIYRAFTFSRSLLLIIFVHNEEGIKK